MARPQKKSEEKRDLTIRVRVTQSEKDRIWQYASECGQSPSDYTRLKTLAATAPLRRRPTPERKVLLDVLAELGKLDSNVNQIARVLNSQNESRPIAEVVLDEVGAAMRGVDALTAHVLNLLSDGHPG